MLQLCEGYQEEVADHLLACFLGDAIWSTPR